MTKEEAQILFSDAEEDFEDFFEMQLFAHKQFFLSKPIVPKIFRARLTKLEILEHAFNVLGFNNNSNDLNLIVPVFSSNVKECFQEWEKLKSDFKLKVLRASGHQDVARLVHQLLSHFAEYSMRWNLGFETADVKVSIEPDPMELLNAINDFNSLGLVNFEEIRDLNEANPLVNESKRLTLLSQMMRKNG